LGAIIAWIFYPQIIEFLLEPYCRTLEAGEECQLYVRNPLEPFSVRLTVAGYGGIIVAMPMILWQFWAFVAPGLYSHEKRYALPFVWGGVALFFAGAGLAYWSIERALDFLSQVGGEDFTSLFAPGDYLGFVIKMIVAFGVAFEFPIVLIFLQILGILGYRTLVSGRQYAIVGIVVLVAFITPSGDPFTLMILSVPMWLFYEISIAFGFLRERRSRKAAKAS
ncbi:MAG TPA: twin-arginine translocase subunit TatC, partial [Acidimicrobiaceae bacterium]|nr:twin-arginine translocase subunit TatC [Acidimicrobiaceae bacterium]